MRNNDSGSLATALRTNCSAASSGNRPATGINSISDPNCFAIFTTKYCFMSLVLKLCSRVPSTAINPVFSEWFWPLQEPQKDEFTTSKFAFQTQNVCLQRRYRSMETQVSASPRCRKPQIRLPTAPHERLRDADYCVSKTLNAYRLGSTSTYSASITPSSFFCSCPDEAPSPAALAPPGKPPGCAAPLG